MRPVPTYFDERTTNDVAEGCNTKVKTLKRVSYEPKDADVLQKMLLGLYHPEAISRTFEKTEEDIDFVPKNCYSHINKLFIVDWTTTSLYVSSCGITSS